MRGNSAIICGMIQKIRTAVKDARKNADLIPWARYEVKAAENWNARFQDPDIAREIRRARKIFPIEGN